MKMFMNRNITQQFCLSAIIGTAMLFVAVLAGAGQRPSVAHIQACLQQGGHHYIAQDKEPPGSIHRVIFNYHHEEGRSAPRLKVNSITPAATLPGAIATAPAYLLSHVIANTLISCRAVIRPAYYIFLFRYVLF